MELMFLAAAAAMQGGLLYLMMRNVR